LICRNIKNFVAGFVTTAASFREDEKLAAARGEEEIAPPL
jgi:hypothetical protein